MFDLLTFVNDVAFDALPFAVVCLGFFVTSKYLRMPDVTASGSFVLGAAVAAVTIVKLGWNPVLGTIAAILAGCAAGALTGFFVTVLGIDKLLSGILSSFALFAINLLLLTPMIAYGDRPTLLSSLEMRDRLVTMEGGSWHPWVIVGFCVLVLCVKLSLDWFLQSQAGLALRAIEDEEAGEIALERQGLSPRHFKLVALCMGNSIVALAGAMVSYKEGAANAQRGFDVLITGLVALLLGTQILAALRWVLRRSTTSRRIRLQESSAAVLGSVCFFALMTLSRRLGISSEFTQILLVCAVALAAAERGGMWQKMHRSTKGTSPDVTRPMLATEGLSFRFPSADKNSLNALNFSMKDGEIVQFSGGNGTGKTTALRVIAGVLEGGTGHIYYRGQDLMGNRHQRLETFVYVDQNSQRGVVGALTAVENLALAGLGGRASCLKRAVGEESAEIIEKVRHQGGFNAEFHDQPAKMLSGGQRQVLNLLTLLARPKPPAVVFLDEPTNNLDVFNTARCGAILAQLHAGGSGLVFVSHSAIPGVRPDRNIEFGSKEYLAETEASHQQEPRTMSNETLPKTSARRVQLALDELGTDVVVREMPASTRTAEEAAAAMGCTLGQIVKSLVFCGAKTGRPYLVLASGPNRVDEDKIGDLVGEKIQRAKPDFVREKTGYAIGGVPPIGHTTQIQTWMDESLLAFDLVWAAAGTPNAVFSVKPNELARLAQATVIPL